MQLFLAIVRSGANIKAITIILCCKKTIERDLSCEICKVAVKKGRGMLTCQSAPDALYTEAIYEKLQSSVKSTRELRGRG